MDKLTNELLKEALRGKETRKTLTLIPEVIEGRCSDSISIKMMLGGNLIKVKYDEGSNVLDFSLENRVGKVVCSMRFD